MFSGASWTTLHKAFTCAMLPKSIKITFNMNFFSCAMLSGASCPTLHKAFTCRMLAFGYRQLIKKIIQHCIDHAGTTWSGQCLVMVLSSQCCPNMSETTLYKKYFLCNVGPERTDMFLQKNNLIT